MKENRRRSDRDTPQVNKMTPDDAAPPANVQTTLADDRSPLVAIYETLFAAFGPQHWWPGESPTEIAIGAVLTQNTAWINVEKAIAALRAADAIDFGAIDRMDEVRLAELIRSAGTFRIKAQRLKALARWVMVCGSGDIVTALTGDTANVREQLFSINGIGPETADAILLYAGGHATFVVDAYTRRILRRHFVIEESATYDAIKNKFETQLPPDPAMYNEYHALLVEAAKRHCRKRADCDGCPLATLSHDADAL